jgi:hypothetical protein
MVASSLIIRVILSAGAMLIFSVLSQNDQMPEGEVLTIGSVQVGHVVVMT